MKKTYEEAVALTVKWWSKKAFDTRFNQNNGDDSENGQHVFGIMNMISHNVQFQVTPEQRKKFEQKLTDLLLAAKDGGRYDRALDVDYDPDTKLSEACSYAGISPSCLPIKTFTLIDADNRVRGRYQYGGDWFEL